MTDPKPPERVWVDPTFRVYRYWTPTQETKTAVPYVPEAALNEALDLICMLKEYDEELRPMAEAFLEKHGHGDD